MRITRIGVAAAIVLASCGGGDESPVVPSSSTTSVVDDGLDDLFQEVETEDQVSETVDDSGIEPPVRNPPSTEPVVTEPPAGDPPSTDPVTSGAGRVSETTDQPPVTEPGTAVAPPESGTVGSSAVFPGNSGFRMASKGIDRQMAVAFG